jgi:hypothetical protein
VVALSVGALVTMGVAASFSFRDNVVRSYRGVVAEDPA